eukprot:4883018-Pleurochrysis_carterae.AAC.1
MLCRDSAEPGPAPANYPLSARLASSAFGTMADLRHFGPLPLLVARSVVRPGPCLVDVVSVGRVDGVDQGEVHRDATSMIWSSGVPVDVAAQMDRFATWRRFALFSRAFLTLSTCCLFYRTLSGPAGVAAIADCSSMGGQGSPCHA